MAVTFPANPAEGDQFISPNGPIFVFTNDKWVSAESPNYADIQGATGPIGASGPPDNVNISTLSVSGISSLGEVLISNNAIGYRQVLPEANQ